MYSAGFTRFLLRKKNGLTGAGIIYYNRYDVATGKPYLDLYALLKDKIISYSPPMWIISSGWPVSRTKGFCHTGDYGLFHVQKACHKSFIIMKRRSRSHGWPGRKLPDSIRTGLGCPVCGRDMEVNLRCDGYFVEDEAWMRACGRYEDFLRENKDGRVVYLELGVGMNTPGIIKYPFWQMTDKNPAAALCVH